MLHPPNSARSQIGGGETLYVSPVKGSKVLRLGLVIIAMAAPLAFGAVQYWARAALLIGALLLMMVWALGCASDRAVRMEWSPLYIPAAAFLGLVALQYFGHLSLDLLATRESLLSLITQLVYFFIAVQILGRCTEQDLSRFGLLVLVYSFVFSIFAILQHYTSNQLLFWSIKPRWDSAVFGSYVNHNHYAGLMEILIPIGIAYVLSCPPGHHGKTLAGFAVLLPIASLMLSGSRGGLVSFLVEAFLLILVVIKAAPLARRRTLLVSLGLGFVAVDLLFLWIAPEIFAKRLEGTAAFLNSPEISLGDRLRVSKDSLRVFQDHVGLGTGLGSFEFVYPQYRSFPSDLEWDHAHNDYAEALAETGLAGGAIILLAIVLMFRATFRSLEPRLMDPAGWFRVGAGIGCCGLLVHSVVDFNLHIPANALWFGISLALATAYGSSRKLARQTQS
jgi:O-antigen ligase